MGFLLRHIARTVGSGVPILALFGFVLWIFNTFLAGIDGLIQKGFSFFLSFDVSYPGLGILIAFSLAYLIGLLRKIPWLNKVLTVNMLFSFLTRRLWKLPIVEVEVLPGKYQKGWLNVTREQIDRLGDGQWEDMIVYNVYMPTSQNPSSGPVWTMMDPESIKYVMENTGGQLVLFTVTASLAGNEWRRRWFRPKEFIPPPRNKKK